MRSFQWKRVQRGIEYALLISVHLFFLLSFRGYFSEWLALALGASAFGLNLQLTQLREWRRTRGAHDRTRLVGDAFESVLFLLFVLALTFGSGERDAFGISIQGYYAYVAALLAGLFAGGIAGECSWQARNLDGLGVARMRNYVTHYRRTILIPYKR